MNGSEIRWVWIGIYRTCAVSWRYEDTVEDTVEDTAKIQYSEGFVKDTVEDTVDDTAKIQYSGGFVKDTVEDTVFAKIRSKIQ